MKISYNWLKDYIDIDLDIDTLAQKITDSGIEVEEIIPTLADFNQIVLGEVLSAEKHPNADKLKICTVNDGSNQYQVICGAPNVAVGQKIPFAQPGAVLPIGIKIKKAKIRGVESLGMICSKEELGLEESSAGIWPLETDQPLGTDINTVLTDYKDYILDLFITSNRPDCLSHTGIAREIAAFTGKSVKWPEVNLKESTTEKVDDSAKVRIEYPEGCPRYAARVIKNVTIGPSPEWLVRKLDAIGSRSINNVVDITNFVLNELGQPLHAFDYDLLDGHEIVVRNSTKGQKFTTLDEKERTLPENTVMICDASQPVAVGGIMGGLNSEVSESTTNILLESAYFTPENIVTSTRKLGLYTDAAQRFEKGTDYENVIYAMNRAAALIQELAGGIILQGIIDIYPDKIEKETVPLKVENVNRILGTALDEQTIVNLLKSLNLNYASGKVTVPSYRTDIVQEIDLIEEVARLVNLDNIPTSVFEPVHLDQPVKTGERNIQIIRENLIACGLYEVFTNSMVNMTEAQPFTTRVPIKILNPISDDLAIMRPSLLSGLLKTIGYNINRKQKNLKIFEIGRVFKSTDNGDHLPQQPVEVAIAITGDRMPESWDNSPKNLDFYDIKGLCEQFFELVQINSVQYKTDVDEQYLDPQLAVQIYINQKPVGIMGRISDAVLKTFDIDQDIFIINLSLGQMIELVGQNKKYKSIAKYPYIEKDLALVLDKKIASSDVSNYIEKIAGKLLRKIEVFDVYSGENIERNKKSIAYRLRFQSEKRTLQDKEVDQIFRKVIKKSEDEFKASLRDK